MTLNIILILALIISLYTDLKDRKILNIVTFPAVITGFTFHIITNGFQGFLTSGSGFLLGIGLLLIPFLLGGMGAGDVKLMGAIGALKGTIFVMNAFLYTALFGGLIAICIIIWKKQTKETAKRMYYACMFKSTEGLNKEEYHHSFPYGVAIFLGTASAMLVGGFV